MEIEKLVQAAILAPSSHNTQPWRFQVFGSHIDLYADRTRALPVNDPADRELTISCGAALLNLRVAAAREGFEAKVSLLPEVDSSDLLARVSLTPTPEPDEALAELAPAIAARRTSREPFADAPFSDDLERRMARGAALHGARLITKNGSTRRLLATLVREGDAAQFANPSWRRELADWMHPRRERDGLTTLPVVAPVSRLVVRHFDLGSRTGSEDEELVETAPLVAVLSTDGDMARNWLMAGQALQRVLLIAAASGVQAGFLNQPCQVDELRARLRRALPVDEVPQVVLRFGVPIRPLRASPRRPVADVLI